MNQSKEEKEESLRGYLKTILFFLLALMICLLLTRYVMRLTWVSGSSMNDTLQNSDCVITEKVTYRFTQPERFDVILFSYTDSDGKTENLVKRIIGLPGERIQIQDGVIYINGEMLDDPYAKESWSYGGCAEDGLTLASDEYFVMGDNRNDSKDSRAVNIYGTPVIGPIHRSDMIGKVWLRVLPLKNIGVIQ